jgi:hypothetical protein
MGAMKVVTMDKTKLEIIIIVDTFASLVVGFFIGYWGRIL